MLQKEFDDSKAALEQKEFDDRKAANIRAVELMIEKPGIKVIELVEILLEQEPGLPVVLQDGSWQFPIVSVRADPENGVRLYVSPPAESTPADGREQADRRRSRPDQAPADRT